VELLFRRHFWIFHVLFLALAAWLVAGAINAIVGSALKGSPKVEAGPGTKTERAEVRTRNYNVANEANIFGAVREDLTVPETECETDKDCASGSCEDGQCVATEEAGPLPELADAVKSKLRGRLVGTAVFSDPTFSVASIVDENEGKNAEAALYSINPCRAVPEPPPPPPSDDEDGEDEGPPIARTLQAPCSELMSVATIKYIEPNRVYFYNRDEKQWEYFELGDEPEGGRKIASRKKKPKKKKDEDLGKGIKKTGDNSYEVEQSEVDKALGNLSSLATQARIVPAFEGGKPVGFKLFSIRPNSLYSKIGIQNGDVIKRINGYEINSPDKALEIYQKLKDSKNVTLDLKRRGKPMTLEYGITP
jgi:general secretion pathway protein C